MQFHVVMTQRCNLHCTYCENTVEPSLMPINLDYSLDTLRNFISKMPEPPVLCFYGGEPLLNRAKVMDIMDNVPAKAFVIQTNGTMLHHLPASYLCKFYSILVSIDGRPEQTDANRGTGTYAKAMQGISHARQQGFSGELIARMTTNEGHDIYKEVMYLLQQPEISHIHWQLDVLWDDEFTYEERKEGLQAWMLNSYFPGITKLVNHWLASMQDGKVLGIVPFMGLMYDLLRGVKSGLRCGAGEDFFSITTDGRITFCPIPPSFELATVGTLADDPAELPGKVQLQEPCTSCDIQHICGGRCLYTNLSMNWGREGFDLVCQTIRHLIKELQRIQPQVFNLIEEGKITMEDIRYPKVPNGVEIIP